MNREPVNTDDPQMTAYALGELSIAESVEFEAKLKGSPIAARELAEMNAVMGLLSKGLAKEWEDESANSDLEVVFREESRVVVQGSFGPARKILFAVAAAVAIMAIIGSGFMSNSGSTLANSSDLTDGLFAMSAASQDSVEPANRLDQGRVASVPQLFLAEEVDDIGGLRLATASDSIDASYLDDSSLVPASYQVASGGDAQNVALSRVDSYLPPVAERALSVVTIEHRLGERVISDDENGNGSPIFVSGFVSMEGSNSHFGNEGVTLASFKPVSISGNPVQSGEMDLEILSELSGVQRELERIVSEMPSTEARRSQLIQILNRNREAVSDLKREFSR